MLYIEVKRVLVTMFCFIVEILDCYDYIIKHLNIDIDIYFNFCLQHYISYIVAVSYNSESAHSTLPLGYIILAF